MNGPGSWRAAAIGVVGAIALLPAPALAFPSYGTAVDDYCTSQQRTPAKPYGGNCALCHNASNASADRTPLFTAYRNRDLDAFCPVAVANQPPVLAPIGSQTMSEQGLLDLRVVATDPDGDPLVLEASGLPTGALFTDQGNGVGQLLWMPSYEQSGNYPVAFKVTDAGTPPASDAETITLSVGNLNRPPVLAPVGNWVASPGEALSIPLSASDPDGNAVAFGAAGLPAAAALTDHADGSATLAWTPLAADAGSAAMTLTVTDDGVPMASDAEQITITVGAGNHPPVLDPIGDRSVRLGELWEVGLGASDPDRDALSFACDGAPTGATLADGGAGAAVLGGAGDQAGNFALLCRVTDAGSPPASDEEAFTLTIGAVNRPPVLDPIGATREGDAIFVRLTARDPDGDALHFAAEGLPSGAELVDHGDATAEVAWRPAAGDVGSHPVVFTVTDDGVPPESASADFVIQVAEPPAPTAPQVRRASWSRRRGELRVGGGGAPPEARVELLDAASGAVFAETTADAYGRFQAATRLDALAVPCTVAARADERASKARRVDPVPAQCKAPVEMRRRLRRAERIEHVKERRQQQAERRAVEREMERED
jgi:hypothetical protein